MVEDQIPVAGIVKWFESAGYTPRKNSLGWTVWTPRGANPTSMSLEAIRREMDRLPDALRRAMIAKAAELEDGGHELGLPAGRAALAWVWGMG